VPKTQAQRKRERDKRDREDFDRCMEREDHICQRCGAQATQMHHGKRKHDPRIRHDPRWHYALCMPCHDWSHRNVAAWLEWMENNPNEVNQ